MFVTQYSLKATCAALAVLCFGALTGCASIYKNHGYMPPEEDLARLVPGVDSRNTVDTIIGTPSATGMLAGGDYYYVRSRVKNYGMMRPEVVDRQVLAISFNQAGVVANIERFDLRDGQIVPLTRRVTDSSVEGKGVLQQMMGNFGTINPADFF